MQGSPPAVVRLQRPCMDRAGVRAVALWVGVRGDLPAAVGLSHRQWGEQGAQVIALVGCKRGNAVVA